MTDTAKVPEDPLLRDLVDFVGYDTAGFTADQATQVIWGIKTLVRYRGSQFLRDDMPEGSHLSSRLQVAFSYLDVDQGERFMLTGLVHTIRQRGK